ncbi:MAG: gliding motility-associated C-terminal domain-containing protein [Flavobacteriales bacterium]|nr:gliding motility-associated C-terminal domain-containing protein [Flavobacteriales bacterium]MCB9364532.1 gliding motility-associated C-terminal domain-containing protein [Flavobacteriales bacterium]
MSLLLGMALTNPVFAQCTYTSIEFDSYEYTTVCPDIIPGTVIHDSPQTFNAYTGNTALYLNIVDGLSGAIYDRTFTICPNQDYRFNYWIADAWGDWNDVTINVYDAGNNLLSTVNTVTTGTWVNIFTPTFTPTTPTIRFEIVTNRPGAPGNDLAFDDLTLEVCMPIYDATINLCSGDPVLNLFDSLANPIGNTGTWTGPDMLSPDHLGTFNPAINLAGTYTYAESCGYRNNNITVNISNTPTVSASATPNNICQGDTVQLNASITPLSFSCQETASVSGQDDGGTSTLINTFSCVSGGTITGMSLDASIGTNCGGPNWYLYDIYINGTLAFSDQCDQTGLNLNAFLPITSVELRAKDDPADGFSDFITLDLTLNITYAPNITYDILWTPNAGTISNETILNPLAFPTNSTNYTVTVSDLVNSNCQSSDNILINVDNCGCVNYSGTMDLSPLNICNSQQATAIFNNDSILGTGDIFMFVLHDSSSTNLGTILATSPTPSFNFSSPTMSYGTTYYISAISGNDDLNGGINYTDTCLSVSAGTPVVWNNVIVDLGADTTLCDGESFLLNAQNAGAIFNWQDGSNNSTIMVASTGQYWVNVVLNGCSASDTVNVTVSPLPNVVANTSSSSICAGNSITLTASGANSYSWNNGVTNGILFFPTTTTTYTVTGTDINNCQNTDQITIEVNTPASITLGSDSVICNNSVLLSPGQNYNAYLWQDGSSNSTFLATESGTYSVTVVDPNNCEASAQVEIITECEPNLWVPNVFTPNNDGKNDVFNAVIEDAESYSLMIYNRWGNLIFTSDKIENGWNGTYKGNDASAGTYIYLIEYSYFKQKKLITEVVRGGFTLLR